MISTLELDAERESACSEAIAAMSTVEDPLRTVDDDRLVQLWVRFLTALGAYVEAATAEAMAG